MLYQIRGVCAALCWVHQWGWKFSLLLLVRSLNVHMIWKLALSLLVQLWDAYVVFMNWNFTLLVLVWSLDVMLFVHISMIWKLSLLLLVGSLFGNLSCFLLVLKGSKTRFYLYAAIITFWLFNYVWWEGGWRFWWCGISAGRWTAMPAKPLVCQAATAGKIIFGQILIKSDKNVFTIDFFVCAWVWYEKYHPKKFC